VRFGGGAGFDKAILHDEIHPGETYFVNDGFVDRTGDATGDPFGGLVYGVEQVELKTGPGAEIVEVDTPTAPTSFRVDPGTGADVLRIVESAPDKSVTLDRSNPNISVEVNPEGVGNARFQVDDLVDSVGSLRIGTGGFASLSDAPNHSLRIASLSVDPSAFFDLRRGAILLDYSDTSPLLAIQSLLTVGYADGVWNGDGIVSSVAAGTPNRALGFAEATDIGSPSTFAGRAIDNSTILIRYTVNGDADLDQDVDVADLGTLASNWQLSSKRWSQGNFDYSVDGLVNVNDLGMLASNWQQVLAAPQVVAASSPRRTPRLMELLF
jgi:hypothetical protein